MTTENQKINKEQFVNWLNTAIPFSVWHWSNKKHIIEARDYIASEIGEKTRNSKDKTKDKDMLLCFLLNLWVGFCIGRPIRINMNNNKYSRKEKRKTKNNKDFFTYKRTRRILKKFERHGFLQHVPGYFFDDDKKEARIWGTEKLIRIFVDYYDFKPIGDVSTPKQEDIKLVQLRDEIKEKKADKKRPGKTKKVKYSVPVKYDDTEATLIMEENLIKYNKLAQDQKITVKLNEKNEVSTSDLIDDILHGLVTGTIKLTEATLLFKEEHKVSGQLNSLVSSCSDLSRTEVYKQIVGLVVSNILYKHYSIPTLQDKETQLALYNIESILSGITNTLKSKQWQFFQPKTVFFLYLFYLKKMFNLIRFPGRNKKIRDTKRHNMIIQKRTLADFGIKSLEFEINRKALHRVFNRASKSFDKGGRFYGPSYQGMSKNLRKEIHINGNETVELDFSGLHIRMLYHELEMDFRDDPYTIGDGSLRGEYKLVSLISINAQAQGAHIAVKDALEESGFEIANDLKQVQTLMKNYQEAHKPIEKYLFSGVGLDLQNKDSQIMEKILMKLHDYGICGLPIHDSVLVEKKYTDLLYEIMMNAYEEVMGFEPVLK